MIKINIESLFSTGVLERSKERYINDIETKFDLSIKEYTYTGPDLCKKTVSYLNKLASDILVVSGYMHMSGLVFKNGGSIEAGKDTVDSIHEFKQKCDDLGKPLMLIFEKDAKMHIYSTYYTTIYDILYVHFEVEKCSNTIPPEYFENGGTVLSI